MVHVVHVTRRVPGSVTRFGIGPSYYFHSSCSFLLTPVHAHAHAPKAVVRHYYFHAKNQENP